jgi:hypothetical protein
MTRPSAGSLLQILFGLALAGGDRRQRCGWRDAWAEPACSAHGAATLTKVAGAERWAPSERIAVVEIEPASWMVARRGPGPSMSAAGHPAARRTAAGRRSQQRRSRARRSTFSGSTRMLNRALKHPVALLGALSHALSTLALFALARLAPEAFDAGRAARFTSTPAPVGGRCHDLLGTAPDPADLHRAVVPAAVLLLMTGFTRIVIVLSLLRQALGTAVDAAQPGDRGPGAVPHLLRDGADLDRVYEDAYKPYAETEDRASRSAIAKGEPIRSSGRSCSGRRANRTSPCSLKIGQRGPPAPTGAA